MLKKEGHITYYTKLPANTQVATKDMFYKNKKRRFGMPFLCKAIREDIYYALRVGDMFPDPRHLAQIINKNAYVFLNKDGTIRYK